MAPAEVEIEGEPTAVYRLYNAPGTLLYVGISRNLVARWAQHAADKDWWPQVARKTVVMYGTREEAELAEGRAIRSESPVHNKAMGRRDESEPKRTARKVATSPSRPVPRESYRFDADFMTRIDAWARKNDRSRAEAVGIFLLVGIEKFEEEEREALKVTEELEALRKMTAAEVVGNPGLEAELAAERR